MYKSSNVFAADPPESEYLAAMSAIKEGTYYLVTEVGETKWYITQNGSLTDDKENACLFAISKVDASNAVQKLFDTAFLIEPNNGAHFSNATPLLDGNAYLHLGFFYQDSGNDRNDWERQVFYLKNGKYAIRTSNTIYGETSWLDAGRVFWSCEPGETDGSIIPCYSYEPAYIWTLELSSIRYQVMMILQGCIDTYANQYYDDEDNPSSINLGTGFGQYSDVDTWHTFKVLLDNIAELIDNLQDPDYDYDSDPNAYTIEQANAVKAEAASLWQEILDSEVLPNDGISFADINVKAICISNWDSNRDGVLSYDEAAAVTDIGDVFRLNKAITSFDELRYFTGLENIGSFAFSDCTALTSVTFPQGLISIGTGAFSDCGNISSITIPESVTNIGGRAFEKTAWYVNQPEGLVYAGKVAYKYKGTMPGNTTIEIEGGTLGIAGEAFEHCSGLNSITIPESVTNIGSHAFYWCNNLSSIAIPSNVISIGVDAFYACKKITSITIPSSVTSIGQSAFAACHGLSSIIVEEGNPVYDSRDNCNALIETTSNTLLIGCKNSTIPNGVTSIGGDAFYQCYGLTSIYIPESVMSIVHKTFFNCRNLTSIIVDEDNPVYDSRNGCNAIIETGSNTLIVGCDNSTIPEGVTSIGDNAFIGCNFTTITIPNSVTRIGDYAFAGCSGLSSIIVPDGIAYIGNGALNNTAWYYNQPDGLVYIGNFAYKYKGTMLEGTTIDIMDGTLGIVGGAFSDCSKLVSVNIPESVTSIGGHAFYGCSSLSTISIPNSVTSIGDYAFYSCNNLASVIVLVSQPLPVTENTFSNRANATLYVPAGSKATYEAADYWKDFKEIIDMGQSIAFEDANVKAICVANWDTNNDGELSYAEAAAVTDLGKVFESNKTITSFDEFQYFEGVKQINNYAFQVCQGLKSITIPNSVTTIGDGAFWFCHNLSSIIIPKGVTSISNYAFYGCVNRESIVVEEGNTVYDSRNNCNALIETASNILILGCNNTMIPNDVVGIGFSAFNYCHDLTSITIPKSVTNIGENVFEWCI